MMKKIGNMKKGTLTPDGANIILQSNLKTEQWEDRIYEFAQDLFYTYKDRIERDFQMVDTDGNIYDDNGTSTDGECWYDEYRDDFMFDVYHKLKETLDIMYSKI